jgi:hypothetical protein
MGRALVEPTVQTRQVNLKAEGIVMKRLCSVFSIMLLVTACAGLLGQEGGKSNRAIQLDMYQKHAGEPGNEAVFPALDSWRSFPGEYIAVRTKDRRYYLLTLEPACAEEWRSGPDMDLAVNQQTRNTLTRFDRVGFGEQQCRILDIQAIDQDGLRSDLAESGLQDPFLRKGRD